MGIKYHIKKGGRVNFALPSHAVEKARGGKSSFGDTRTEQDKNLQEEGWGSCFANEQQRDYCKFLEKNIKDNYLCDGKVHLRAKHIHSLMKQYGKTDA